MSPESEIRLKVPESGLTRQRLTGQLENRTRILHTLAGNQFDRDLVIEGDKNIFIRIGHINRKFRLGGE